jgi:hypothetical protein
MVLTKSNDLNLNSRSGIQYFLKSPPQQPFFTKQRKVPSFSPKAGFQGAQLLGGVWGVPINSLPSFLGWGGAENELLNHPWLYRKVIAKLSFLSYHKHDAK